MFLYDVIFCAEERDCEAWILLLQGLESLTRDEHPHQWFNIKVLLKAGTVQRLLEGDISASWHSG